MSFKRDMDMNDGQTERYTPEVLDIIKNGSDPYLYPNVNWFDEILKKNSMQSQYNINISGSALGKLRYFISGSYVNQGTLLKHQDIFEKNYGVKSKFDRYNFRSNVDLDATSMLNIRIDLAGRLETRVGPGSDFSNVFSVITTRSPSSQPVFNPDGTLGAGSALEIPFQQNPYGIVTQSGYYTRHTNVMSGTLSAKHKLDFITKGLSAQVYFSFESNNYQHTTRLQSFDSFWYKGKDATGEAIYQPHSVKSRLSTTDSRWVERYTYLDVRLNYDRTFAEKHQISAQLLGNRTLRSQNAELPYAYQGISSRIAYNFDTRYYLEANIGYNGSENFPPKKRYGFFPSFSAGWVLSDEKFISLPSSQVKTYLDIEFLNDSILKNIKTTDVSEEDMAKNHIENMQFSFKHPIIYSNKKIYKKWDCGYIFCGNSHTHTLYSLQPPEALLRQNTGRAPEPA